ncbi:MAG: 2-oxoacid:acceptor oxidoreductase subunit alpha [Gemmatimonadetes bacterium]|nr:2-oxoacid:acceptor oxidoreductase subunit alpha [Gemmatimonadota bacterium]NIO32476.1 2-oxoacid:acceptor oxidoreductase subunit alpha [Gemmatimonadota bacterium]
MTQRQSRLSGFDDRTLFLLGDEAAAYGALYAGCDFFAGYPITPASEIAEVMSRELPRVDGYYVQMEDEIASLSAVIGAVWAGAKAMTATSGPGFSLMQENIGYAIMTETPCVIIDVQRSGPSTGQATKPAQGDVLQARWGTHGDHEIIALAPSSVQECFELTVDSFNLAEKYRIPVILLMDGEIGHLRESITFPDFDNVAREERRLAERDTDSFGGEDVPPMSHFGEGRFIHVTGSTHKASGMRDVSTQAVHEDLVTRLCRKISDARARIISVEEDFVDGAKIGVLAYGATARPARGAVLEARSAGCAVDFLRLITIWPFPEEAVKQLAERVDIILVPEMNLGQLAREVERFAPVPVVPVSKIGGVAHTIDEILETILASSPDLGSPVG